jgi:hypothetical protein
MGHECIQEDTIKGLVEFKGSTESDIKTLYNLVTSIKDNDLKHITEKIDKIKNDLSQRPSWAVFWIITSLTSLLLGVIGFELAKFIK